MSSTGAAPRAAVPTSNARTEASRKNGARSRGPVTPEGKARSARNALKHGLRAEKHVVLPDEDAAGFAALEAALHAELTPQGVLQSLLVRRIVQAAWRLERADRMEAEVLEERRYGGAGPGLALIRDGNGTRSFETLMRYRGATLAELMRSLRTLKALQAEPAAAPVRAAEPAPVLALVPRRTRSTTITPHEGAARGAAREENPIRPEAGRPGDSAPTGRPRPGPEQLRSRPAHARPNEPEARRDPRDCEIATPRTNPRGPRAPGAGAAR